jgi:D-serine deaminase-like pyridoxal phosphate-dependent protein
VTLSSIPTPRVVVDLHRLKSNIAAMQSLATRAGVRLRPHAKTHKSPVIARWQIEAGAVGICCAKLGEAEVFADAGIADIRLPYPVHPSNAARVLALQDRTRLSIIVDDLGVARAWSHAMTAAGRRLDVLIKVDVGFHRCGINAYAPDAVDTIRSVAGLPGVRLLGLLSHAGHGYTSASAADLEAVAWSEIETMTSLAWRAREAGVEIAEISVGATPTARFITRQTGATEMRPGNYVFFDRTQVGLGAAALDDCALHVVSTLVSHASPTRAIFDAGAKTLAADGCRGFGAHHGHGLVFPAIDAPTPDPAIILERLSEEHATARVPAACALRVGDRVRILPNHACVVTNLVDELLLVEGMTVVDRLPVAARGRIW